MTISQVESTAFSMLVLDQLPDEITWMRPVVGTDGVISDFEVAYCNGAAAKSLASAGEQLTGMRLRSDGIGGHNTTQVFYWHKEVYQSQEIKQFTLPHPDGSKAVTLKPFNEGILSIARVQLHPPVLVADQTPVADGIEFSSGDETEPALITSILDASLNGIFVMEAIRDSSGEVIDFCIVHANKKFLDVVGKTKKEVIGSSYLKTLPSSKGHGLFDLKKEILATGKPVLKESFYQGSGIEGWFLISIARLGDHGIVETFFDITQSKLDQERIREGAHRFETVVNTSKAGMFTLYPIVDATHEIVDFRFGIVNQAVASYIGQTAEVLMGSMASIYFPAYKSNGLFNIYKENYTTGKPFNFDFHYEDGYDVFFNIDVVKMGNEVLVTFTDHTALKRLQREMEKNLLDLTRLNVNLQDFTYAASHDLKEPVRKIRFFSDRLATMMQGKAEPEEQGIITKINDAAKRMSVLIDDLLTYSHVSQGAKHFEAVDVDQLVASVLIDLELSIQEKKAQFHIGTLPVVQGHKRQLHQLFQNIIANALKYSQADHSPVIKIAAAQVKGKESGAPVFDHDSETIFHAFSIEDNGIGFEQTYAERIFNVFTRLHGKSEYGGTGVGLSIVKKVVENHNGYVWAKSKPGQGSTFYFLLPA